MHEQPDENHGDHEKQQAMPFHVRGRKRASLELKLRVLSAVDYAPGNSIRARIKQVALRTFVDVMMNSSVKSTTII